MGKQTISGIHTVNLSCFLIRDIFAPRILKTCNWGHLFRKTGVHQLHSYDLDGLRFVSILEVTEAL